MAVGDDAVSAAFNLDFTFTFYEQDFTSARMATNGCLHFGNQVQAATVMTTHLTHYLK
jgi:hypothetical protein